MTGMDIRALVEQAVTESIAETGSTEGLIVSEFVIIAGTNGWDDAGDPISQVIVIPVDGNESRILGLVEHARTTMKADIVGWSLE